MIEKEKMTSGIGQANPLRDRDPVLINMGADQRCALSLQDLLIESNRSVCKAIEMSVSSMRPVDVWTKLDQLIAQHAPISTGLVETEADYAIRSVMNNLLAIQVVLDDVIATRQKRRV